MYILMYNFSHYNNKQVAILSGLLVLCLNTAHRCGLSNEVLCEFMPKKTKVRLF